MDIPLCPLYVREPSSKKRNKRKADGMQNNGATEEALKANKDDDNDALPSSPSPRSLEDNMRKIQFFLGDPWRSTPLVPLPSIF